MRGPTSALSCAFILTTAALTPTPASAACGTCRADFDNSGFVDFEDHIAFVHAFEAGTDDADFDESGFVDTDDFDAFVCAFLTGCGLDFNHNGKADCNDFDTYIAAFNAQDPLADFNCDGVIDASDFASYTAQHQHEIIEFSCDSVITCKDLDRYTLAWASGAMTADLNCDDRVTTEDFHAYIDAWMFAHIDTDGSGTIECADLDLFKQLMQANDPRADINCDKKINATDLNSYTAEFHSQCPACGC
ncbi:MAG: hypothetical protein IT435_09170 [Phycisphaerales bacterium]|nr:hypothetical protein [Phycisphaerales bacterium]